ncbi:hypothetical protein [Caudoviricetes sp.]|nr:hypothetical protein [Caudoviricetes sp.]
MCSFRYQSIAENRCNVNPAVAEIAEILVLTWYSLVL